MSFGNSPWTGGLNEQEHAMSLSTFLKTTAAAGLVALSVSATTSPASARVYETQCYGGDCYRMSCSDYGYNCRRMEKLGNVGDTGYRERYVIEDYRGIFSKVAAIH